MAEPSFAVHGARGSSPTSGAHVARYGGHTTCYSLDAGPEGVVVVDAGTGIAHSPELAAVGRYHLFFTHFHLDHIQGLPFFAPIYDPEAEFVFYGVPPAGHTIESAVANVFHPPWFPVHFRATPSEKSFVEVNSHDIRLAGLTVSSAPLRHPQGCTAYRFERGARSIVIATDHEAGDDTRDAGLMLLSDGADCLVHDGQYTHEEYAERVGWGHSTWEGAAQAADRAGVGSLILTSHDPSHSDATIDGMVRLAGEHFEDVRAAEPGLTVPI